MLSRGRSSRSISIKSMFCGEWPSHLVADPWSSRSTSSVRYPIAAAIAARFTADVVFPVPPLLFATAVVRIRPTVGLP